MVDMTGAAPPPKRLDPSTIAAVNQALSLLGSGRSEEACSTLEAALERGGDLAALNALLGLILGRRGEKEAALHHLSAAHEASPNDVRIAANLASALIGNGDLERALEVASSSLAFTDPTLQLARIRGYLGQMLGQPAIAVEAYLHVVSRAPQDFESLNNLGNARIELGDLELGIADLERACAMMPGSAPPQLNLARAYRRAGNARAAEDLLRAMAERFPGDAKPLADLHDLLKLQGRDEEALEALERALEREPANVEFAIERARQLAVLLRLDDAEEAFKSVLDHHPGNAQAFVGLAIVYEHARPESLAGLAEKAAAGNADPAASNLVRAYACRRARQYEEGLQALEGVPEDFESAVREHLLGQMLEGAGKHDAAFAAFARMNDVQSHDPTRPLERAAAYRARLEEQLSSTTSEWIASWKGSARAAERAPIFLVGFPRSGTTLLDTFLMGHPGLRVIEERPVAARVIKEIGGFGALAGLDEGALLRARSRYFDIAAEYVALDDGALLVDKSPLLMNEAAALYRLFPNARFILALRHPADVLLSCFVSNFRLNDAMSNFLDLATAAQFYDLSFCLWERARSLLPLDVQTVVYEEMVQDPGARLRPLIEQLGLEWRDEMLDHRATAAKRGLITTASYAQVTEPIYKSSVARWQRYRGHLDPILPVLRPWIEKFGYQA